ncbi:uncharacterized protein LOC101237419 isoform X2 [Hydra vulgaris]|uniref:Uncharacterized protein LOC101237419 isoform X2 n=1 Tax=Hydra vulgaris TaxID=6087 RepID=A0ABM4CCH9_HYDVU
MQFVFYWFFAFFFLNQIISLPVLDSRKSDIINAGEIFELHFNNKLDLSIDYKNCSKIFDTDTIAKLGSQPICRVFSENVIRLIPSQDANLTIDDSLNFDNISISSNISFLIENYTAVDQLPVIKISGPNSNCRCSETFNDSLKVNIDLSNLTGYAPLKNIEWNIYDNEFANGKGLFAAELKDFQGQTEITIQSNWFTASQNYYIYVQAENVFGNTGNASKRFSFSNDCLPYVEILLNSLFSDDDSTVLKGFVTYPLCSNQSRTFTPDWLLLGVDLPSTIDSYSDLLYIPQQNLQANSYGVILRYTVSDAHKNELKKSATFDLNIKTLSSEINIVGGNRTIGKFNALKLNTELAHPASTGSYVWLCSTDEDQQPCIQNIKDIVFPPYSYLQLNLKQPDLLPEHKFTIEAGFKNNGLTSKSTVNILVLNGDVPQINLQAKKKKVSYNEPIIFIADVENVKMNFNYTWFCSYKYDDTNQPLNHDSLTIVQVNSVLFPDGRIPTIIKQFPPFSFDYGRSVVCKFSFPYKNQLVYAYEEVEIVIPIKDAIIIASPQSGLAYEDKFRFRVSGWHQSNVYLFRFGIYAKYNANKESDKIYKSMWSAQNWIENVQFFMEKGNGPGNQLKIFYEIMNDEGFVTTIVSEIVLNPFNAQNGIKIAKKAFDFDYYLRTDQFQCAEYFLDILPLVDVTNLLAKDLLSIQKNLVLYLAKFRTQGFIGLLVTKAMDVMYKFVYATKGIMNQNTLMNITTTLNYISVNLLTVGQEIDSIKMTQQLVDILNTLINFPGNLEVILSQTPNIIKGFLNVAGSNYDNQQESFYGSFISGLFTLERFLLVTSSSVITLNDNLRNKYGNWPCQNSYPFNCTGVLIVQAQYDYNLFPNTTFGEDWTPVSDVYELALYNPATFNLLSTDNDPDNFYEASLLLKNKDIELSNISNVQCQVWNPVLKKFDPTLCYYFAYMDDNHALCRCKSLGKMVALHQPGAFPTTESTIIDPTLTYTFYFHMDYDPYCSTTTRMKSVTNKFSYQLQQYIIAKGLLEWPKLKLTLRRSRLVVVDCLNGGFGISTINMTIKDKYGELRNWFIKQVIENMIENQTFQIEMKQGGNIPLFDVNQTTPQPVVTIPPIQEIKTNWTALIASIVVFVLCFLACAFGIYFHQSKLLAQKIYTNINSDKPKELSEAEKEKQANKKLKLDRLNDMHLEGFVPEEKSKSSKKIRPVSDANATVSGDSFFFRDSPMLDSDSAPRYALDDSDSEDIFTSKTTLIKSASVNKEFKANDSKSDSVEHINDE